MLPAEQNLHGLMVWAAGGSADREQAYGKKVMPACVRMPYKMLTY